MCKWSNKDFKTLISVSQLTVCIQINIRIIYQLQFHEWHTLALPNLPQKYLAAKRDTSQHITNVLFV